MAGGRSSRRRTTPGSFQPPTPGPSPDFAALAAVEARGVIATTEGSAAGAAVNVTSTEGEETQVKSTEEEETQVTSQWFGPQSGIPDDSYTGSAHCA